MALTFKSSPNGSKHAVYSGACRIGYIDRRNDGECIWTLILLQPTGTAYMGRADDADAAKRDVEAAFALWCEAAGLLYAVSNGERA